MVYNPLFLTVTYKDYSLLCHTTPRNGSQQGQVQKNTLWGHWKLMRGHIYFHPLTLKNNGRCHCSVSLVADITYRIYVAPTFFFLLLTAKCVFVRCWVTQHVRNLNGKKKKPWKLFFCGSRNLSVFTVLLMNNWA